ncbi:MAG: hypothetical protein H8E55_61575, partial [Pelagibacterales bacterium]|nr:hypothetical protein [Pelagibacterales bacterium]
NARPKSSYYTDKRLITKLMRHGVDYIELRTLDINPLSNIGLDIDTLKFLELFIMYCTFKDSPPISKCEMNQYKKNDLLVAKYGRKEGLLLKNSGKDILLKQWANNILDEMIPLAEYLGGYDELLQKNFLKIKDSNLTLSGLLMRKYLDSNISFYDFNFKNGELYKKDFLEKKQSTDNANLFLDEARDSIIRQNKIENSDKESFEKFVDDYFS